MSKNLFIGLLVVVLVISSLLVACSAPAQPAPTAVTPTAATPATTPAKVYEWNFQATLPPVETDYTIGVAKFAEMVDTNTGGRIKLKTFPAGGIVQPLDTMNAVRDGVVEMGDIPAGYGQGAIPALAVLDGMPLTWQSGIEAYELLYDFGLTDLVRGPLKDYGIHLLGCYGTSLSGMGMLTKKKVSTLDDFKGMKVRTYGAFVPLYEKLGCSIVAMGLGDVYQAAQTGIIDGVFTNYAGHILFKTCEVLKNGALPVITGAAGGLVLVNPKAYDSLPPDLQKIFDLTFDQWSWWMIRNYNRYVKTDIPTTLKALEGKGVTFTTLSASDQSKMTKLAEETWNDIASKDALAAKAVGIVKEYLKKAGRLP